MKSITIIKNYSDLVIDYDMLSLKCENREYIDKFILYEKENNNDL
jgi:hypothetical protein